MSNCNNLLVIIIKQKYFELSSHCYFPFSWKISILK